MAILKREEKVWLITGSSGIGAAAARLAARRRVLTFICALDEQECEGLATELGDSAAWHAGDLAAPEVAEWGVTACLERYGKIDAVFNVAGGSGRQFGDGPLHKITDDGWRKTLDMNLTTMFNVSRAVLPMMIERRTGNILNMSTVTAFSPEPKHFATHAYAAAKGAVIAMTKAMAAYYASYGIRINALAPGLVRTPMSLRAQNDENILEFMKTKQKLAEDGLIEAEDVARAAVFLMSEEARHITGQTLTIDAGWQVS